MGRWLYQRYRHNLHWPTKPPRPQVMDLLYIWPAHLWAWWKSRQSMSRTTPKPNLEKSNSLQHLDKEPNA